MSTQEIIAELPKLKPEEIRLVKAKVDELAGMSPTPLLPARSRNHWATSCCALLAPPKGCRPIWLKTTTTTCTAHPSDERSVCRGADPLRYFDYEQPRNRH